MLIVLKKGIKIGNYCALERPTNKKVISPDTETLHTRKHRFYIHCWNYKKKQFAEGKTTPGNQTLSPEIEDYIFVHIFLLFLTSKICIIQRGL